MGRRIYEATNTPTISSNQLAAGDFWNIKAGAGNGIQIHWIVITASGVSTVVQAPLQLKRFASGTTASGGTSPTSGPVAVDDGDTKAAGSTVLINATATAGGTVLKAFYWNVMMPFDYMPGPEDEDRDSCIAGEMFALNVSATTTVAGLTAATSYMTWREVP